MAGKVKQISEDAIKYVVEHINDRPRTSVAVSAGISITSLYKIVRKYNGEINHRLSKPQDDIAKKISGLYINHTGRECAEILDIDKSTVARWAQKLGLSHNEETTQRIIKQRNDTLAKCRKNIDFAERARTWKRRRKMDELRVLSGQEQKTHFRIKFIPRRLYQAMYYLSKKYGYTVVNSRNCEMMRPSDWGEEKYYLVERHFRTKHKIYFFDYVDEERNTDDSI